MRQPIADLILSNTARAGVTGFLKTVAREVADDGVTVNTVQPGMHATGRITQLYGARARCVGAGHSRRASIGDPDDFGHVVAFLCSEHAKFVTGRTTAGRRRRLWWSAVITHVVSFRWKPDTSAEQINRIQQALQTLPGAIPEIASYRCGSDLGVNGPTNMDFAIVATFDSVDAWHVLRHARRARPRARGGHPPVDWRACRGAVRELTIMARHDAASRSHRSAVTLMLLSAIIAVGCSSTSENVHDNAAGQHAGRHDIRRNDTGTGRNDTGARGHARRRLDQRRAGSAKRLLQSRSGSAPHQRVREASRRVRSSGVRILRAAHQLSRALRAAAGEAGPIGQHGGAAGDSALQVSLGATAIDQSVTPPKQTYTGPQRLAFNGGVVTEVVQTGDFEAVSNWAIGVHGKPEFRVTAQSAPARLVIDIVTP